MAEKNFLLQLIQVVASKKSSRRAAAKTHRCFRKFDFRRSTYHNELWPIPSQKPMLSILPALAMSRPLFLAVLRRTARRQITKSPTTLSRQHVGARFGSTDSTPITLAQPDKFRPPSHPQRLNRKPPRQYRGPPLSEAEMEARKTKRYPRMFPNVGTKLHWFLTSKWIHVWITLVGLVSYLPYFCGFNT